MIFGAIKLDVLFSILQQQSSIVRLMFITLLEGKKKSSLLLEKMKIWLRQTSFKYILANYNAQKTMIMRNAAIHICHNIRLAGPDVIFELCFVVEMG